MNTCATCIHWGQNRNYATDDGHRIKSCNHAKFVYGYYVEEEDIPDDGVSVGDDAGWGMLTGPDFGCIHWGGHVPSVLASWTIQRK